MKKTIKLISLILCLVVVFSFSACDGDKNYEESTTIDADFENVDKIEIPVVTEEVTEEIIGDYENLKPQDSQVGVVVDSCLKIVSVGEKNGKLSVLVRNISDIDVQYALLSVVCEGNKYSFEMSTVTQGATAVLTCRDDVPFNVNGRYHSWKIEDKILFENGLSLYPEVFEIKGADGAISVKNISKKNIEGPIYVYYKSVEDGVFTEGTTYRISIDGLEKGQEVHTLSDHYKKDTSLVMFVTYAE